MAAGAAAATTTLPIIILSLLLISTFHIHHALDTTEEEEEELHGSYVLDSPLATPHHSRSRFLASIIKRGARCLPNSPDNMCNGVSANNGTRLLHCCKKHCRDVLGDRNNCGSCGNKCGFAERCCGGDCINVAYSPSNCGKCNRVCSPGIPCHYGVCGYA